MVSSVYTILPAAASGNCTRNPLRKDFISRKPTGRVTSLAWILFLSGLHMRKSDVSLIRYLRYNLSIGIIYYRYDSGGQNSSDWTSTRVLLWVRIKWEINLTLTTKHVASIAILMRMIFRSLYLERYEWTVGLQRPRSFYAKGCQEHIKVTAWAFLKRYCFFMSSIYYCTQ